MSTSETSSTLNTVTVSTSAPPVTRVGWQCPGCRTHYSPDVPSCACGNPGIAQPAMPITVWPWYYPYSVPGCAGNPAGWYFTYNAGVNTG